MDDSRLSLDLSKLESVTAYITPNCLNQAFRWFHCIVFEGLDCCLWYNKETCVDSRRSSWIGKHSLVEPRLQRRVLTTHPLNHRRRRLWIILQVTLLCFHSPPLYPHLHPQTATHNAPPFYSIFSQNSMPSPSTPEGESKRRNKSEYAPSWVNYPQWLCPLKRNSYSECNCMCISILLFLLRKHGTQSEQRRFTSESRSECKFGYLRIHIFPFLIYYERT